MNEQSISFVYSMSLHRSRHHAKERTYTRPSLPTIQHLSTPKPSPTLAAPPPRLIIKPLTFNISLRALIIESQPTFIRRIRPNREVGILGNRMIEVISHRRIEVHVGHEAV
jgi:hypothetical protein